MSATRCCFLAALAGGAVFLVSTQGEPEAPGGRRGLASIQAPPGFRVELAARPGLVRYPMLGTVDDRGRLFLCESSGRTMKTPEMSANPDYQVTLLEDTDGDGVFDKGTVFADRLTLPAGAVWLDNSLYVAAPPSLFRFADTDGDGRADVKEIVVTGWNLSANAASLHGPILGPDGWLYLTDGRHGFKIQTKEGKLLEGKASRIWRVRPDGSGLESFAGGGFDNPVEVVFTDAGEVIGTMTYFTDPKDGQRDALLHFVEGGVYPKPHLVMEEFPRTGDLMPVMTKFARVAPAGLLRYSNGSFGPEYHGNLFSAHFNSHRVLRHRLFRSGATFRTEDEDFLVSSDPDLHPTDVIEEADGALLVVDTGAWFIHGCPLSRVSKPDIRGALYRVRRIDGRPAEPAVTPAAEVFRLARAGSGEALRKALDHPDLEARIVAARMIGMARDARAVPRLMEMVRKEEAPVRRQAATALGQIGDRRASRALLEAAADPEDRFVEHAVIYSLIQLGDAPALSSALGHPSAQVRKAGLIALDQMQGSPIRPGQVLPLLGDGDAELRWAALWVLSRHPGWSPAVSAVLEARLRVPQLGPQEPEMAREAMAALCRDGAMQDVIGRALGDAGLAAARRTLALEAAERCPGEFPAGWIPGLRSLLGHRDAATRLRAIGVLRTRGVAALDDELLRMGASGDEPGEVRIAALGVAGARRPQMSDADFRYLVGRLRPEVEAGLKLAAGQVISRAVLSESQLVELARGHLVAADPLVLPNLLDTFRHGSSEKAGRALVSALAGVQSSLGPVGGERVAQVLARYPAPVRDAARPVVARIEAARRARLQRLRRLEPVLYVRGDAVRGQEIFFGAKAGCSSCHTIGTDGGHVGPDLTSIGAIRSPHDLLEAIVLPSESFVPGHEVYRVETAREVYSGVLRSRGDDAVILVTGPGDEVRIPRKDVVKMGFAPVSLMPEGFDEVLTSAEMADLIAFLRSQTARPESPATRSISE